jgi:hypothetical protein
LVSTTSPPSRAWATIPAGWAAASQTSSRRRLLSPLRYCQAATNNPMATTKMATVTSLLPNSTQR